MNNKNNVLDTLDEFINDLKNFRDLIDYNRSEDIYNFIKKAKTVRKKIIDLKQS